MSGFQKLKWNGGKTIRIDLLNDTDLRNPF
jgi:hypothetical protein